MTTMAAPPSGLQRENKASSQTHKQPQQVTSTLATLAFIVAAKQERG